MFTEFVIPRNNEKEFVSIASRLGYKKLFFLYDFSDYDEEKIQKKLREIKTNVRMEIGFLVNQKNFDKAAKKSKLLIAKSSDNSRFFVESKKIKLIYGFEEVNRKDFLHQRASGLNHVVCELARKNKVVIGFYYSSLFNMGEFIISQIIGRMIQNISLCQKYKVKTVIGSFSDNPFELRSPYDVMSFFIMLGMNGKNIKNSLSFDM
jgi:RNase P/RNase MRP subunit p30